MVDLLSRRNVKPAMSRIGTFRLAVVLLTGVWHDWAGHCDVAASGYTDGATSAARFNQPQGICIHPRGDLLVADTGNHCLRKITPEGLVSTYAGICGEAGDRDGDAEDAMFSGILDIQCLANCSVLVTEPGSGRIRLILDSSADCPTRPTPGSGSHGARDSKPWAMLAAAAATGIVVGAALMLWLNAHAGKVQTRLNSNIEQYQSLQGHDQDCEAADISVSRGQARQPSNGMRALPGWVTHLLPAVVTGDQERLDTLHSDNTIDAMQSGSIAQRTSAARQDAMSQLRTKQAIERRRLRGDLAHGAGQSLQADADVFNLFDGTAAINLHDSGSPQDAASPEEQRHTDTECDATVEDMHAARL